MDLAEALLSEGDHVFKELGLFAESCLAELSRATLEGLQDTVTLLEETAPLQCPLQATGVENSPVAGGSERASDAIIDMVVMDEFVLQEDADEEGEGGRCQLVLVDASKEKLSEFVWRSKKGTAAVDAKNQVLKCICGKTYVLYSNWKKHFLKYHTEGKHLCDICGSPFVAWVAYLKHIKEVHDKKVGYSCRFCFVSWATRRELDHHIKHEHCEKRPFACADCPASYGHLPNLSRHVKMVHRTAGKKYLCTKCCKAFRLKADLKTHQCTGIILSAVQ